jgi:hypothetical protein
MSDDLTHRIDAAETRNQMVWRRYCCGESQQTIADSLHISQARVSQIIGAVRVALPKRSREEIRQEFAEQLHGLRAEAQKIVDASPGPAYRGDSPIFMPDKDGMPDPTRPVWDHSGRLHAMAEVRKLQERAAKLLGVDEPTKLETDATVRYVVEGVNPEALS